MEAVNDGRITEENNAGLWSKLKLEMDNETRDVGGAPGWVVVGTGSYRVIQQADGSIAFMPKNTEAFYESTSF